MSENAKESDEDRRLHERYDFTHPIQYVRKDSVDVLDTICENICFGGLMLLSMDALSPGDSLTIKLPYEQDGESKSLEFQGSVIWRDETSSQTDQGEEAYRVGVQFMNVSTELFHELELFIHKFCKGE